MAPRVPVALREIVYTLSPYQQEVLKQGIEKLPSKAIKFVKRVGSHEDVLMGMGREAAARGGSKRRQSSGRAKTVAARLCFAPRCNQGFAVWTPNGGGSTDACAQLTTCML